MQWVRVVASRLCVGCDGVRSDAEAAAAWLLDDNNLPEIMAQSMFVDASSTSAPIAPLSSTTSAASRSKRKRDGDGSDDEPDDANTAQGGGGTGMRRAQSATRLALLEAEGLRCDITLCVCA
jgi:hypothetical protein